MNSLLVFTLVLATAATEVVARVDKTVKAAEEPEVTEIEYDADGVPMYSVPEYQQNLIVGIVGPDDRLMARINHQVAAAVFIIHNQDITVYGHEFSNITSVQVTRVGTTTQAIPSIKAGGLGHNFVVINIQGVRGRAIDFTINIFTSIGCPTEDLTTPSTTPTTTTPHAVLS